MVPAKTARACGVQRMRLATWAWERPSRPEGHTIHASATVLRKTASGVARETSGPIRNWIICLRATQSLSVSLALNGSMGSPKPAKTAFQSKGSDAGACSGRMTGLNWMLDSSGCIILGFQSEFFQQFGSPLLHRRVFQLVLVGPRLTGPVSAFEFGERGFDSLALSVV